VSAHHPSPPTTEPRRKAVLFCPDCGHESAVDGDWNVHESNGRRVYECPVCAATVTTRYRSGPLLAP